MNKFKLNFELKDLSDEELKEAYDNATGQLNRFDVNLADRIKIRALLEDIEDLAEERGLDL